MTKLTRATSVTVLLLTGGEPAQSIPLPVVNPGFEDTTGSVSLFNEFSFGALNGWQVYDDPPGLIGAGASAPYYVGTLQPQPDPSSPGDFIYFPGGAPEGERVAIAYNRAGSGGTGAYGLEQTLGGTPLELNRRYTLRVEVGNIASGLALSGENFDLEGFPGYRVELLAGGQVIAADDSSLSGSLGEGTFATSLVEVSTANAPGLAPLIGSDLGIRLINLNEVDGAHPDADLEVDFDHVRLAAEPALAGDFNYDGAVDAGDYTAWRDGLGVSYAESDYTAWQANYGARLPIGVVAIPEPTTFSALATLSICFLGRRFFGFGSG